MPSLTIRKPGDTPLPSRVNRAVREQQELYEGFIREAQGNVGELELGPAEQVRSAKVRLRRAATRLSVEIDIWDADGRVYFAQARRPGRPRKRA